MKMSSKQPAVNIPAVPATRKHQLFPTPPITSLFCLTEYFFGKFIVYLGMTRNGYFFTGCKILIDVMFTPVPEKNNAILFKNSYKIVALHIATCNTPLCCTTSSVPS